MALVLVGLYLLFGAAQASAVATGVCNAVPNSTTKKCETGTYYPETEKFTGKLVKNVVITNEITTLECTESRTKTNLGANPNNTTAVSVKLEELTFGTCKVIGGNNCTLTSPATGETGFPWAGFLQWTTFGLTGPNGTATINSVSIKAVCGTREVFYIGGGTESSIEGKFFNANDTNKPVASTRAELQFEKTSLLSRRVKEEGEEEKGPLTFSAVYNVEPKSTEKNVYLSNG